MSSRSRFLPDQPLQVSRPAGGNISRPSVFRVKCQGGLPRGSCSGVQTNGSPRDTLIQLCTCLYRAGARTDVSESFFHGILWKKGGNAVPLQTFPPAAIPTLTLRTFSLCQIDPGGLIPGGSHAWPRWGSAYSRVGVPSIAWEV
jgi:hypothetical protein